MAIYFQKFELPLEKSCAGKMQEDKGQAGNSKHEREHRAGLDLLKESLFREFSREFSCTEEEFCLENELAKEEQGKPWLKNYPQIHFNISHGKDMVVCGVDRNPLGVDVEAVRPVKPNIFRRVLTKKEQEWLKKCEEIYGENGWYRDFFRLWTLKESYAKAVGKGLAVDFTRLEFMLPMWEKTCQERCFFLPPEHENKRERLLHGGIEKERRILFSGEKEENRQQETQVNCKAFFMEEVLCCHLDEEEKTGNPWHFFQTIVDQEYVISCCLKR